MFPPQTLRQLNCNHDLNKYIDGVFVRDDYCFSCQEQISELESESVRQEESLKDTFKNVTFE